MDKQTIKDNIGGIKTVITALRDQERVHIKIQTLSEQVEKSNVAIDGLQQEVEALKGDLVELKTQKRAAMEVSVNEIRKRTAALLPIWDCYIRIEDDGTLALGMIREGRITPYKGLSGGEKVMFDMAMSNALLNGSGEKILVVEAAEVDDVKLVKLMETIIGCPPADAQVIISTCHDPGQVFEGFNVVRLQ